MGWGYSLNQETRNAYKIVWGKLFVIAGMDNGIENGMMSYVLGM
jgi:hypothetical protein